MKKIEALLIYLINVIFVEFDREIPLTGEVGIESRHIYSWKQSVTVIFFNSILNEASSMLFYMAFAENSWRSPKLQNIKIFIYTSLYNNVFGLDYKVSSAYGFCFHRSDHIHKFYKWNIYYFSQKVCAGMFFLAS